MNGKIRIKVHGKMRSIYVADTANCKDYECFHPHDCPVQGARGIRSSTERYMCLTNVNSGCPESPKRK